MKDLCSAQGGNMTDPTTDPAAHTDQELKQALARVIALARSEGLDDIRSPFWRLYEEILCQRASSGTAAWLDSAPGRIRRFKQKRLALTFRLG